MMLPFVLSGGSGTRLWPVSRAAYPKQFCELFEESLLAATLRRLRPLAPAEGPDGEAEVGVVGAAASATLTRRVLRETGISERWALFEPVGRNTAPAVALVCHRLLQEGRSDEIVGIFPADHRVADAETFRRAVRLAERMAGGPGAPVVTLGIRPDGPNTGYGYIETAGAPVAVEGEPPPGDEPLDALPVAAFHEKPDAETAARYVAAGRFYWNAGMFVFRAAAMAEHFERLMPTLWSAIRRVEPDLSNLAAVYAEIEPESLDYGIMEHLREPGEQITVPCDPGWSDVGSWDEVARIREGAGDRSANDGRVAEAGGARGNHVEVHADRVYGLVGVEDLLVVDTDDALLIARRGASQEVKEVVRRLRESGRPQATEHSFEVRPWGRFDVLRDEDDFKSKVIRVDPGQRLSYQSHRHRAEHWVIVRGRPEVTLDDRVLKPGPGEHVFIPRGAKHRIANPGAEPVLFVEVQVGDSFAEDDIVRYEDDYERK